MKDEAGVSLEESIKDMVRSLHPIAFCGLHYPSSPRPALSPGRSAPQNPIPQRHTMVSEDSRRVRKFVN